MRFKTLNIHYSYNVWSKFNVLKSDNWILLDLQPYYVFGYSALFFISIVFIFCCKTPRRHINQFHGHKCVKVGIHRNFDADSFADARMPKSDWTKTFFVPIRNSVLENQNASICVETCETEISERQNERQRWKSKKKRCSDDDCDSVIHCFSIACIHYFLMLWELMNRKIVFICSVCCCLLALCFFSHLLFIHTCTRSKRKIDDV